MTETALVWFRHDLRLADNPALRAAAASRRVVAVYIHDDAAPGEWRLGGAARWWLHHSLVALAASLAARGHALVLRQGDALTELDRLVSETAASAVFWNRRYEPWAIAQDRAIKAALRARGLRVRSFNGSLLREPWEVADGQGQPLARFAAFARAWLERGPPPEPLPAPVLPASLGSPASLSLAELGLLPTAPDWAGGLRSAWRPGEAGAAAALERFVAGPMAHYRTGRHLPAAEGTSRLSPHLRFGEISPRQIWRRAAVAGAPVARDLLPAYLRQLVWRELAYHLLYFFPHLPERDLHPGTGAAPRAVDRAAFAAWCQGRTGYPIVDAGMRELWRTGYMHNRVRMLVASFLTKDLLVPWQRGAAWFWDCLCDADLANNAMGWQWVAGTGAGGSRYPRVFNPVLQGERFDPQGAYVRRWVPELAALPDRFVHRPFAAPKPVLAYTGIELGRDYPEPLVDHGAARLRALDVHPELGL